MSSTPSAEDLAQKITDILRRDRMYVPPQDRALPTPGGERTLGEVYGDEAVRAAGLQPGSLVTSVTKAKDARRLFQESRMQGRAERPVVQAQRCPEGTTPVSLSSINDDADIINFAASLLPVRAVRVGKDSFCLHEPTWNQVARLIVAPKARERIVRREQMEADAAVGYASAVAEAEVQAFQKALDQLRNA
jgi:hypothetical protein